jgi:beta-glucanase (GH16 family)
MRLIITFLTVLGFSGIYSQINFHCPIDSSWQFNSTFSDEFNGKKLNSVKWWDFNPSWTGRKPAYFDRKNVKLSKGNLTILAKRLKENEVSPEYKARGQDQYSTGIVKSKTRVLYGYFEARCKMMESNVCNAFWLYDPLNEDKKYIHGDFSEEIDIFEVFGKARKKEYERTYWATIHRYETPYVESIVNKKKTKLENHYKTKQMPYEFYDDFHVFGLLWTPDKLQWFLDGELIFERVNDFFHRPLHVVFDAEIMDTWMGLPEDKDLPSTFFVDYVRVWKYPHM